MSSRISLKYYTTIIDFASPAYDEAIDLRDRVLRQPLNLCFYEKDLAEEYKQLHLALYDNLSSEIVGILVLKKLEDGTTYQMRQVAVDPAYQGKGLGGFLVEESERLLTYLGAKELILHARETAVPFYEKLGYKTEGKPYTEVNIPHRDMRKKLG